MHAEAPMLLQLTALRIKVTLGAFSLPLKLQALVVQGLPQAQLSRPSYGARTGNGGGRKALTTQIISSFFNS